MQFFKKEPDWRKRQSPDIFVRFVLAGCHVAPVATHHIKANTLLTFNTRKILLRKHEANGGTVIRRFFFLPNGLEDGVGKAYLHDFVVVVVALFLTKCGWEGDSSTVARRWRTCLSAILSIFLSSCSSFMSLLSFYLFSLLNIYIFIYILFSSSS